MANSLPGLSTRIGPFVTLSLVPILLALSVQAEELQESIPPISHLGALLPLSGEFASGGEACKNGMVLAHETLSPELQQSVKISFEDYGMSSQRALAGWQKLHSQDGANIAMTWDSGSAMPLNPILKSQGVPHIALTVKREIPNQYDKAIAFWISGDTYGETLVAEAVRRGYKRVARITALHEGILEMRAGMDRHRGDKLEIVAEEEVPMDARDFKAIISRLKRHKADAYMIALGTGQNGLFAKQLRDSGDNAPVFGIETFEDKTEIELANGALEGQWYVQTGDLEPQFLRAYQSRFPGASTFSAGHCHELVKLIAEARRLGVPLASFLRTAKNFRGGALGEISATGDGRFTIPAAVREIRGGTFVTVRQP